MGRQPAARAERATWARCRRSTPPRRTPGRHATSARAGPGELRGHPAPASRSAARAGRRRPPARLWEHSERLTGVKFPAEPSRPTVRKRGLSTVYREVREGTCDRGDLSRRSLARAPAATVLLALAVLAAIAVLMFAPPRSRARRSNARREWREQLRGSGIDAALATAGRGEARGGGSAPTSTGRCRPRCERVRRARRRAPTDELRGGVTALCREVAAAARDAARRRRVRRRPAAERDLAVARSRRSAARTSAGSCALELFLGALAARALRGRGARAARARAAGCARSARQHETILDSVADGIVTDRRDGTRHLRQPRRGQRCSAARSSCAARSRRATPALAQTLRDGADPATSRASRSAAPGRGRARSSTTPSRRCATATA